MIPIRGLFETHVTVSNLECSVAFYRDLLGLETATIVAERRAAFFWIGGHGQAMLGIWETGSTPLRMNLHFAFTVDLPDLLNACERLRAAGVTPLDFFGAPSDEPSVLAWMPAASVYFNDPDGNQLEFIAMLPDAPRPELGILNWSDWQSRSIPS